MLPKELNRLANAINDSDGAEILSAVKCHENGIWYDLRILARGNSSAAPAILRDLEPGDILLHNHPNGLLRPSDADLNVASLCGNSGVGFAIHDNECSNVYVVVEPFIENAPKKLVATDLVKIISDNGELSNHIVGYEERNGQKKLMRSIIKSLNKPCHALLEGETGIGKSMAYLIPAIYYAKNHESRVVVSTNTINLQYQLFKKDLPLLEEILPVSFKYTVIKGRHNYICQRKMYDYQAAPNDNFLLELDELEQFRDLVLWIKKTKDGSLTDLTWVPSESLWEKVCCDKDSCLGVNCPEYSSCFYYISRRRAASSDIIVANHHLVFADLAMRAESNNYQQSSVLPAYKALVLDEAHNLENTATSHFGYRTTSMGVQRMLGKLYKRRQKKEQGTLHLLYSLISYADAGISDESRAEVLDAIKYDIIPDRIELADDSRIFFDMITDFTVDLDEAHYGDHKLRIGNNEEQSDHFKKLAVVALRLGKQAKALAKKLKKLRSKIMEFLDGQSDNDKFALPLVELGAYSRRITGFADSIGILFNLETEIRDSYVHFFSVAVRKRAVYPSFHSLPINVAEVLVEKCFTRIDSVLMVSGTLTTKKNFDFMHSRLGLMSDEIDYPPVVGAFKSPFDYKKQSVLFLPTDIPEPNSFLFIDAISEPLLDIVRSSSGGVLVLCTSYSHLNQLHERLGDILESEGFSSYKQGEMERQTLVDEFKKDGNAVLFATDSFWEGVDIPGEALRNLVILKLPFVAPNDPVVEARQEMIKKSGLNPFTDYQLPMAAIKLKQGFGRLIRNKTDKGAIWILDKRIVTKWYGKYFLSTLPKLPVVKGEFSTLTEKAQKFFLETN